MALFDVDMTRDDQEASGHTEPFFSYINRSARPTVHNIRNLLEEWFAYFPEEDHKDFLARFHSDDDRNHHGAFFELYCHALLRSQGFTIHSHQTGSSKTTRPDFLAYQGDEPSFYMECTITLGSDKDYKDQKRLDTVLDAVDEIDSPYYLIQVDIMHRPSEPPPLRAIQRFLEQNLRTLDPDVMWALFCQRGLEAMPCMIWRHEKTGWTIGFRPIPKSPDRRTHSRSGAMGAPFYFPRAIDPRSPLQKALSSKKSKYGSLNAPFVIAVNSLDEFMLKDRHVWEALFGQACISVSRTGKCIPSVLPNGLLHGLKGPINRRISATLIGANLTPWKIASDIPVLWHNPWAIHPIDLKIWQGPQMVLNSRTSKMELTEGKEAWEIFGLDPDWPGIDGD